MEMSSFDGLCVVENMARVQSLLFNNDFFKNIRHSHKEYDAVDK